MSYNQKLWKVVVDFGKKFQSDNSNNVLDQNDIETIIATMDWFNATLTWKKQSYFDLSIAKYKVFDWLAMSISSRNNDNRLMNVNALKVLVYAFIQAKYDEKLFIKNLRSNDYEIIRKWEKVKIDNTDNLTSIVREVING